MPSVVVFRFAEWHWVHCWEPISCPPLRASAEPGFSGNSKVSATVGMTSRPDFTFANRNVTVSALTGSWQAMHEIWEWDEARYARIVSSCTAWHTSAQNQRVEVAPSITMTKAASANRIVNVQTM